MADRKLVVEIVGDDSGLHRAFSRSSKDAQNWGQGISRVARGSVVATVGFRGLGRSVAFASAAFIGGAGFTAVVKGSIEAASNLNEQLNKTRVIFDKSAKSVVSWSKTTDKALGISQSAALEAAGGFGAMLETAGLTSAEASKFSTRLVQLAADMASFNNIDPDEALLKLKSGLAGEAEPLRTVGVLLSETRVKQEAYRAGIAKAGATLTEQQKVLARYNLILKDTGKQQGDFSRTSGGLANQQRILAAQVENLQAKLGAALLPSVLKVVTAINKWLGSSKNQARLQRDVTQAVRQGHKVFEDFVAVMRPLASLATAANTALGGLRGTVRLLVAAFIAAKVVSFTGAITGLGGEAAKSATGVKALRLAMLRLGAIGIITIGIELVLNRKEIQDKFAGIVQDLGRSLGETQTFELPVPERLERLRAQLKQVAEIMGTDNDRARELRAQIDAIERRPLTGVVNSFKKLQRQLEGVKNINVGKVQDQLQAIQNRLSRFPNKKIVGFQITEQGIQELQRKLRGVKDKTIRAKIIEEGLAEVKRGLDSIRDKTVHVRVELETFRTRPEEGTRGTGAGARAFARDRAAAIAGTAQVTKNLTAQGNAVIASIERQTAAQGDLNQQFANSEKRAAHLRDLIRQDPENVTLQQRLSGELQKQAGLQEDIAQAARGSAQAARDSAQSSRDNRLAVLDVLAAQATLTNSLKDDLAVAKRREGVLRQMVALNRDDLSLAQKLVDATQARLNLEKQIAEARATRIKGRQFKALGLTETGEARTPSAAALLKRAGTLGQQIKGTILDTPKTEGVLARIAKVLSGKFGKVGKDVRSAIQGMLKDIADGLDEGTGEKGPLTKFKKRGVENLIAGLGLTAEQVKELRQRVSQGGAGGTAPGKGLGGAFGLPVPVVAGPGGGRFVIENHIFLDGKEIATNTTKHQQKQRGRGGSQRRGVRAGGPS